MENNKSKIIRDILNESRLPKDDRDPQFGIPEQEKYPLFDKQHVISAIKLFGHVEPRYEEKLARAIIAKMKKYGISYKMVGEDNRLYKYIPKDFITESPDVDYIIEEIEKPMAETECPSDKNDTCILNNLRSDLQDELTAIKNYDVHADAAEKSGYDDIAKVLRDIRDEEKVHIGEIQAILNKYDETFLNSVEDGEREVEKDLLESLDITESAALTTGLIFAGSIAAAIGMAVLDYKLQSIMSRPTLVKDRYIHPGCNITVRKTLSIIKKYGRPDEYKDAKGLVKRAIKEDTRDPHLKGGSVAKLEITPSFTSKMDRLVKILENCLKENNLEITERGKVIISNNTTLKESLDVEYYELSESVLDPIHKTRPVEIFKDDKMLPEVKEFIFNLLEKFKKDSGLDFEFKRVIMIGSSTGLQYNETSDIDINVEVDKPSDFFEGKFYLVPKGVILPNTQKPINVFMMFSPDETAHSIKYAENVYDLHEDKFVKVSNLEKQEIPLVYVSGLSSFLMNGIDVLFGEFERNKKDLEKIIRLNPNEVEISEKERDAAISKKINDIQTNADALNLAHHFLFVFNNEGYQDSPFRVRINYKFDDPHYSMNSLVYKYIDSFGYLEKMNAFEKEANELVKMAKREIGKNFNNPTNEVEQKEETQEEIKEK